MEKWGKNDNAGNVVGFVCDPCYIGTEKKMVFVPWLWESGMTKISIKTQTGTKFIVNTHYWRKNCCKCGRDEEKMTLGSIKIKIISKITKI